MATRNDVRSKALESIAAALDYLARRAAEPSISAGEQSGLRNWQTALTRALPYFESVQVPDPGDDIANRMLLDQLDLVLNQIAGLHEYYSFTAVDQVLTTLQNHLRAFAGVRGPGSGPGDGNPI